MAGFNHTGTQHRVLTYGAGVASWDALFTVGSGAPPECQAQVIAMIKKHSDGHRLHSPEQIRHERGEIWAYKGRCGLRVYFWMCSSPSKERLVVIGHVVLKKKDKANPADLDAADEQRDDFKSKGYML